MKPAENGSILKDGREPGWFMVENELVAFPISPWSKLLYMALCRHANRDGASFPKVRTLSDELGFGKTKVKEARAELEQIGLLEVRDTFDHGRQVSNTYFVKSVKEAARRLGGRAAATPQPCGDPPGGRAAATKKEDSGTKEDPAVRKTQMKKTYTPSSAKNRAGHAPAPSYDPWQWGFDRFWEVFPKGCSTGEGTKTEAYDFWCRLDPDEKEIEDILDELTEARHGSWMDFFDKRDGEPLTDPKTWLLAWWDQHGSRPLRS